MFTCRALLLRTDDVWKFFSAKRRLLWRYPSVDKNEPLWGGLRTSADPRSLLVHDIGLNRININKLTNNGLIFCALLSWYYSTIFFFWVSLQPCCMFMHYSKSADASFPGWRFAPTAAPEPGSLYWENKRRRNHFGRRRSVFSRLRSCSAYSVPHRCYM